MNNQAANDKNAWNALAAKYEAAELAKKEAAAADLAYDKAAAKAEKKYWDAIARL